MEIKLSIGHKKGNLKYADTYSTIIDDIDSDLAEIKWTYHLSNGHPYASHVHKLTRKREYLHRLIAQRVYGKKMDGKFVDHINRDSLDNRRSNLRPCTQAQNAINKNSQSNNTSGRTGVYWDKEKNKWFALISVNHVTISLGKYANKEDAIAARVAGEIKYFGEFNPK